MCLKMGELAMDEIWPAHPTHGQPTGRPGAGRARRDVLKRCLAATLLLAGPVPPPKSANGETFGVRIGGHWKILHWHCNDGQSIHAFCMTPFNPGSATRVRPGSLLGFHSGHLLLRLIRVFYGPNIFAPQLLKKFVDPLDQLWRNPCHRH